MPAEQLPRPSKDEGQERARKNEERALSKVRLLQEGAEYVVDVGGGLRFEVTPELLTEIHDEMDYDFRQRFREIQDRIQEEINDVPIEDIIASDPEIAAHVEAISLRKEGEPISLIRMRGVPEFAMPVWANSNMRTDTSGRVLLHVPDSRLPKGVPYNAEFTSVCACCSSETIGSDSPFQAHMPQWGGYLMGLNVEEINRYNLGMENWRATEEGRQDAAWREERKRAYRDAMQRACTENGIQFLAMRHGEMTWNRRYGKLEGVEMLEITKLEEVREKMRTLRVGAGLPEAVRGFVVRD